ncbi:MAG: STAS domain-containing protein [Nitrosomonas sp.]|nr:STAS domain-containing protein [Nitrosomonas sp.]
MIYRDGNTLVVEGGVTLRNVAGLTRQGIALLDSNALRVDLQKITEVDSTAISMLFEWQRMADRKGCRLEFIHFPESLASLMQLYGVTSLFTSSPDHSSAPS